MKFLLSILIVVSAFSNQCTAQDNPSFTFPEDILEKDKVTFSKDFKSGNILYKLNCAKCHTTSVNNKEVIPDFSLPQLLDYEIRFAYPDHLDPMREVVISKEELDKVILFLQYKKRNEVAPN